MEYKIAIKNALIEWDRGTFRWKSTTSTNAVAALNAIIKRNKNNDKELKDAVDWFMGNSNNPLILEGARVAQIKRKSTLYTLLTKHLKTAQQPILVSPVTQPSPINNIFQPPLMMGHISSRSTALNPPHLSSKINSEIINKIGIHHEKWAKIEVTDIPTSSYGIYQYTEKDPTTTLQKGSAAGVLKGKLNIKTDPLKSPYFWVELGCMVLFSKVGRCFSCSAAVVHTLVQDTNFDAYEICVMGNKNYDHYFVWVGNNLGEIKSGNGIAIDIWQGNLAKPASTNYYAISPARDLVYWKDAEVACSISHEIRVTLRDYLAHRND